MLILLSTQAIMEMGLYICTTLKLKKLIGIFLVLVFVLQQLPIKQAVNYFLMDNDASEEVVMNAEKSPEKNSNKFDENHFLNDHHFLLHPCLLLTNVMIGLYHPMVPSSHADDIETPPPNVIFA